MVRQAKLGRTNRMKARNLYGKENDMPIGRLAARRATDVQKYGLYRLAWDGRLAGTARPTILPLAPPFRSQCGSMIYTFYTFCTAKNKS